MLVCVSPDKAGLLDIFSLFPSSPAVSYIEFSVGLQEVGSGLVASILELIRRRDEG